MIRILTFTLSVLVLGAPALRAAQPLISDVRVRQLPGTQLVEVLYNLEIDKGRLATVTLLVSRDNGTTLEPVDLEPRQLWGDFGVGVAAGQDRRVVWDAGKHGWDAAVYSQARIELTATWEPVPDGGDPTAVAWEAVNDRWVRNYYANGHITMSDRDTGLMWVYNASANGTAYWHDALYRCENLTYAGHSDWSLPNKEQLSTMSSHKEIFRDVQNMLYWSSTPHGDHAWSVSMADGNVNGNYQGNSYWVWPCRGGQ